MIERSGRSRAFINDQAVGVGLAIQYRHGDEVVMATPAFVVYKLVTFLFGAKAIEVPLRDWRHDLPAMRAAITSGAWPVGSRIPSESELCAQLNLSRGTVREAVRALAHAGLLTASSGGNSRSTRTLVTGWINSSPGALPCSTSPASQALYT